MTQQAEARRLGANEQTLGLWAKAFRVCISTSFYLVYFVYPLLSMIKSSISAFCPLLYH